MEENAGRILQMLQDGKINAQEAAMLLSALRGEAVQVEKEIHRNDWKEFPWKEIRPIFWMLIVLSLLRR